MEFQFIGALVFAVATAVVMAGVPLGLQKLGFFKWLGNSALGSKVARFFGSNEPSAFAMNISRVAFFLLIGWFVVSGITTDATQYELHKPVILQMESCQNTFTAQQYSIGQWAIKCDNSTLDIFNQSNVSLNFK